MISLLPSNLSIIRFVGTTIHQQDQRSIKNIKIYFFTGREYSVHVNYISVKNIEMASNITQKGVKEKNIYIFTSSFYV